MERTLCISLTAECSHNDSWPFIEIIINSEVKYSGLVKEQLQCNIKFESLDNNHISLNYKNKRSGPYIWDTLLDNQGNIIKDQHIQVKNIKIDECNLNFLIPHILLNCNNGDSIKTNGYIGFNGSYDIEYCEPYYDWVHVTRVKFSKKESEVTDSSLPFITNYVYDGFDSDGNTKILELLDNLQDLVNATKDFNFNDPVLRTA